MKTKNFLILVVLATVVVLAGIWLQRDRSISQEAISFGPLVPELKDGINSINSLKIVEPGNNTLISIERNESGWRVREKDDYPANVGKIRDLLIRLSLSKIIEEKTSNSELYGRLGVDDIEIEDDNNYARQLELGGLEKPVKIIIGDKPIDTANTTYVRRAGEKTSWLINDVFYIDDEQLNWLDKSIIDVVPERVRQITIAHTNGDTVELLKASPDDFEFDVQNLPEGREQASGFVGNSVASSIASLSLEDVLPVSENDVEEKTETTTRFETFDGMIIDVDLFTDIGTGYAHFSVTADESLRNGAELSEDALSFEQVKKQAEALNDKLSGWVYEIPGTAYDSMTMLLEEFLETAEEAPDTEDSDSSGEDASGINE